MPILQQLSEQLARKTSRRGLFGRGAEVAFGALAGVAAGTIVRTGGAVAGGTTACSFPGRPCPCDRCQTNGVCAKPCVILTTYYAAGCWVTTPRGQPAVTCCDCDCQGLDGFNSCGCGTDYHNNPQFCPA